MVQHLHEIIDHAIFISGKQPEKSVCAFSTHWVRINHLNGNTELYSVNK